MMSAVVRTEIKVHDAVTDTVNEPVPTDLDHIMTNVQHGLCLCDTGIHVYHGFNRIQLAYF